MRRLGLKQAGRILDRFAADIRRIRPDLAVSWRLADDCPALVIVELSESKDGRVLHGAFSASLATREPVSVPGVVGAGEAFNRQIRYQALKKLQAFDFFPSEAGA